MLNEKIRTILSSINQKPQTLVKKTLWYKEQRLMFKEMKCWCLSLLAVTPSFSRTLGPCGCVQSFTQRCCCYRRTSSDWLLWYVYNGHTIFYNPALIYGRLFTFVSEVGYLNSRPLRLWCFFESSRICSRWIFIQSTRLDLITLHKRSTSLKVYTDCLYGQTKSLIWCISPF